MMRVTTNDHWEIRPGGMLVQKRTEEEQHRSPLHIIRVRVKHGSSWHEIPISCEASFGELKKRLSGLTGLHEEEQKLLYKNKEKDSKEFLDIAGVKDKSKLVLLEDPIIQEKRYLERKKRKNAEAITRATLNLDTLAGQVSALESMVSKGDKVDEKDANNLIDLLMNQLVKLDEIIVHGQLELQRQTQVKRIQEYVQSVDKLKLEMENSKQEEQQQHSAAELELSQVVVTTEWEIFDLL